MADSERTPSMRHYASPADIIAVRRTGPPWPRCPRQRGDITICQVMLSRPVEARYGRCMAREIRIELDDETYAELVRLAADGSAEPGQVAA